MLGKILGGIVDVVNLPVKVANATLDIMTAGNGSKESRRETFLTGDLESVLEEIAEDLKTK